jgi:hypothetical protein
MKQIDFSKELKDLYTAKEKIQEVMPGPGTFIAVESKGEPGGAAFQNAIQQLFSVVYTLKFMLKNAGVLDLKVNKLECLWFSDPKTTPMSEWRWRVMIRIPGEVDGKDVKAAQKIVKDRKGIDVSGAKRIRWKEGRAIQMLHLGPYEQFERTYNKLMAYAEENSLSFDGPAHEIYMNDPRMTAPEKLKTIVRLGVKKR